MIVIIEGKTERGKKKSTVVPVLKREPHTPAQKLIQSGSVEESPALIIAIKISIISEELKKIGISIR